MARILGLETSCDETAAAVVRDGCVVESNVVWTQDDLHAEYAGVVPEIASRAHLDRLMPVVREALSRAEVDFDDIDAVAVGNRPGLIGSLIVGVSAAQALAWALSKPLIGVDHVHAHLWSPFLAEAKPDGQTPCDAWREAFPALGLVVSGGHTTLYELSAPTRMRIIGRTLDDAVGEAYDKAAVILNREYPGGPSMDQLAQTGNADAEAPLPRSLLSKESLDFSFSGLKTALLYRVRGNPVGRGAKSRFERDVSDLSEDQCANIAAAFQQAAMETVVTKLQRALDHLNQEHRLVRSLILGGGVSANSRLRARSQQLAEDYQINLLRPELGYCLDNAAMIAGLADHHYEAGQIATLDLPAIPTTAV